MDTLLPLGTVINIKDDINNYLIVGKRIKINNNKYDYLCIQYPYGLYENCLYKYVNDNDIISVSFLGNINK